MKRLALWIPLCLVVALPALADTSFQFSMAGAQLPPDDNVDGCRISFIYGSNNSVSSFDLGIASLSQSANSSGVSFIFGVGHVTGQSSGLAGALINVHSGEDTGANAAFINAVKTVKSGANIGFVNFTDGFSAVDLSGLAVSQRSSVQVGFVNITKKIETIQIGFLNAAENGVFPVFPFFNIPKN